MNLTDQFVKSLLEGSNDGICVAEIATGKVVYANAAAGQLMECDPAELIGSHQSEFAPPGEADEAAAKFRTFSKTDSYKEVPINVYTKTGKIKPVLVSGSNTFTDANIGYTVAYFKDLTANKRLDEIMEEQAHLFSKISRNILQNAEQLMGNIKGTSSENDKTIHQIRLHAENLDKLIKGAAIKSLL